MMSNKILYLFAIVGFSILLTGCSIFEDGNELKDTINDLQGAESYTMYYGYPGVVGSDIKVEDNKTYFYNLDAIVVFGENLQYKRVTDERYELVEDGKTYLFTKEDEVWNKKEKTDDDFSIDIIDFKKLEIDWFKQEPEIWSDYEEDEFHVYVLKEEYLKELFTEEELGKVEGLELQLKKDKYVIEYSYGDLETDATSLIHIEIFNINQTSVELPSINN